MLTNSLFYALLCNKKGNKNQEQRLLCNTYVTLKHALTDVLMANNYGRDMLYEFHILAYFVSETAVTANKVLGENTVLLSTNYGKEGILITYVQQLILCLKQL